ncbi:hypothetical protein NPIL_569781 [Nephila pilipes]|uniref:TATA box-binding protein-associated factor RNA polymerase I subunit B n=1 Tax=Nephila pilipes TaxID=299642 RepID=A0A8X6ULM3_NEPPI|nr:hypothetical protein NPIL_569781 [Nephila pilipes]
MFEAMNCAVCDKSEFILIEGVYYCSECDTQVQSSRLEQSEHEGFSRRTLIGSSGSEKEKKVKKKGGVYDNWTTPEAYTIILKKQVSALIRLGASEKLKDVVLYIWCLYLQKCEFAFREDYKTKSSIVPCLGAYAAKRDVNLLYGNKLSRRKYKPRKKKKIKKSVSETSVIDVESGENITDSAPSESDYVPSEMEEGNTSESSKEGTVSRKVKLSSAAFRSKIKVKYQKASLAKVTLVHELDLSKTLSICYLGLIYTGDNLLLSDIHRLVNERRIPYLYATDYIPSSMKLLYGDSNVLTKKKAPDIWQISLMSAKLINFLKLPKFKHRSLMPIVYCFVTDLNLPGRIILVVQYLINKLKKEESEWYETRMLNPRTILPIPVYEVQAMAAIIVALKLFYVLDGEYEQDHSEAMMKINILLKSDKLFVWNDWRQQTSLKEYLFMKNGTYSDFSNLDRLSADLIARHVCNESNRISRDVAKKEAREKKSRKEIQSMLQQLLHMNNPPSDNPSSFPIKSQLASMMSNWKKWHFFKETEEIDFTFINKDFSSRLLFYVYDEDNEDSVELIHILLSSLYESAEVYTLCNLASFSENVFRTSSKYWFKNFPRKVYRSSKWIEQLPESFAWLLQLLSKYIHVESTYLYGEVLNLEKKLFLHAKVAHCDRKF